MNKIKSLTCALTCAITLSGCGDFGDTNIDPNNPSQPNASFMFTYACKTMPNFTLTGTYNPWNQLYPQYLSERKTIQHSTFLQSNYGIGTFYTEPLRNLETIIKLNTDETTRNESYVVSLGSSENQIAACRTLRAFIYMHLTDALGMLPYSEALKGDDGNFTPKYDTQEFIYTDLNKELAEAYSQFNENGTLSKEYDILYNGNISYWKKLNASIRMMMAIKLSDVAPDTGKERFSRAYADGGMTDNTERLEYKYLAESANENPLYNNIVVQGREDFAPSKTLLDQLIAYKDPRLEAYADPNSEGEYDGIPFGITISELPNYTNTTAIFDERYYKQNSPMVIISPSHILLIQAEAALRGWISADAEKLYQKGIAASFDQYGLSDKTDEYIAQPQIAFTGSTSEKIEKIAMQRWLANFMQDGFEAWSDWRRLNVPKLKPGPGSTALHIPYRKVYDTPDFNSNKDNYDIAIALQGPDTDDTRVWWDVAPNN